MDLWMNLLFGNPVGLMSMIVIIATFVIIIGMGIMIYTKSRKK